MTYSGGVTQRLLDIDQFKRRINRNDPVANIYRNAIDLNRYSNAVANQVVTAYNDVILSAVDDLRRIDMGIATAGGGIVSPASYQAQRLRVILAQLRESLDAWAGTSTALVSQELQGLAELQTQFVTEQMRLAIRGGVVDARELLPSQIDALQMVRTVQVAPNFAATVVSVDPTAINFTLPGTGAFNLTAGQGASMTLPNGQVVEKAFRGLAESQAQMFNTVVRNGLLTGEPTPQIARRLVGNLDFGQEAMSVRQRALAGGEATKMANHQVMTIVRTSVQDVSNQASQQVYQANQDITGKYRYVATLDGRTSALCFFGSTNIVPFGNVQKVFRRWYSGVVVIVTTASGQELIGTPNHPVLTAKGWRSLQELKPSKDVLYRVMSEDGALTLQDVDMPSSIASVTDPLFEPSVFPVLCAGSSPEQFHGDGMGFDSEINVALIQGGLSTDLSNSGLSKQIKEFLFGSVHALSLGPSNDHRADGVITHRQTPTAMQVNSSSLQCCVDKALASGTAQLPVDLRLGKAFEIELGDKIPVNVAEEIALAPSEDWHDAEFLQQTSDRSGRGAVLPADLRSRGALSIEADNVVSVKVEFRSGHVYNLETSSNIYAANGLLVHNCRSLDGKEFRYGEGPIPPQHWNCRSSTIPIIDYKALNIPSPDWGTGPSRRASKDGPVAGSLNYGEWLKQQPKAYQAEVLGSTRAAYFNKIAEKVGPRDALARMVREDGSEVTLKQLQQRYGEP